MSWPRAIWRLKKKGTTLAYGYRGDTISYAWTHWTKA